MSFPEKLEECLHASKIPSSIYQILSKFYDSYCNAIKKNGYDPSSYEKILEQFLDLVTAQLVHPYVFQPFHQAVRHPFDYYAFGLNLIRPLVIFKTSKVKGMENLEGILHAMKKGENVILLANHQTEPDPQAISLLLENTFPNFAEQMIFVAGHRVITDPLAVPFSMGRNLLCIYSKKYIQDPPEKTAAKLLHNQKTMKKMSQLLAEGGKCIYVAPSGGRDRPGKKGIEVAPFDPQSIEMFWLMAQQAGTKTHFYPFALATYDLLPPPNSLEIDLGEKRHTKATPLGLAFGSEIDMENFPGADASEKRQRRLNRANYIWEIVKKDYQDLVQDIT
jgi:glycerol-3-phosphate O-acyltransferase